MTFSSNPLVDETFMAPAHHLLAHYVRNRRKQNTGLSDERFLTWGVMRALDADESGRAFLQARADQAESLPRSTWFDAFKSKRRLEMLTEVATKSYQYFDRELGDRDWLAEFEELNDHPVWAVDGHQIAHATHSERDGKGRYVASGMIYGLCLHRGLMRPLARFQGDAKRRHEWPVFKENWQRWLQGEPRQLMPIIVADPAYVNNLYWVLEKIHRHAMIITREKENMEPMIYGPCGFDPDDPINRGVVSDDHAGYSNAALRRIHYRDPATGKDLVFITTCNHLRPGLIALLYFLRWKIEKAYDVFKNRLGVTKAWGTGDTAALMQAHFVALLHNLLTVLLARLEHTGLSETKVIDRQKKRRDKLPPDKQVPAQNNVRYAFALTCQFIRTVRNALRYKIPWEDAYPLFKLRMESYL
ncbi:hypothetical protein PXH66_18890 [Synoicihabitans lomoniglobus]|uniref:Transposase IS4-like domain-containing protein n=2 Tax=Synoicihabitans lomoniglobus TaxID=2909285 RepID=A0AAE9ZSH1_9BACT|nr:hypothetical protein PXH66_18890 [Opitutaceae bacterium LMO-M01]